MSPRTTRRGRRWLIASLALLLGGLWYVLGDSGPDEEKALRTRLREAVKERFPEESAASSRIYGLARFERAPKPGPEATTERGSVVLVHGLDDPGKVWRRLAPELRDAGFDVWLMEYPNDQPIAESAALLFEELKELRVGGTDRVSIVAHSMGGLVCREMLTSPDTGYANAAREDTVPRVATLILVGTPNHGSPLARFRGLAEVRDQLARVTRGDASWLGWPAPGARTTSTAGSTNGGRRRPATRPEDSTSSRPA